MINMYWAVFLLATSQLISADPFKLGHFVNKRPRSFGDNFRQPFVLHTQPIPGKTGFNDDDSHHHHSNHIVNPHQHHREESGFQPSRPIPEHKYKENDHICALLVPDYSRSDKSETCITVGSIDEAFQKAVRHYRLKKSEKMDSQLLGELGKALTDVASVISYRYNLTSDVINNGLPLINTMRTSIGYFCPSFLTSQPCNVQRYRSINGMCNNLQHPHWGAAHNTFRRLMAPSYADGVSAMRVSINGSPLPSTRQVSAHLHKDFNLHDHAVTMMLVAWGQVIDHDITFTAELHPEEKDANGRPKMPDCCNDRSLKDDPQCVPIDIPSGDSFYSLYSQKCMNMLRSLPGAHHQCKLGPRDPFSTITAFLDASFVYGSDEHTAERMRTFSGGLLKTLPVFREHGLKDLLPPNLHAPDEGCIRHKKETFCFDAGDGRVNEQLVLAVIQTLFVREHNRIAEQLATINPHWDDETVYQETRMIVGAEVQHITFNEFLPMVLGRDEMQRHTLLRKKNKEHKYNPDLDPTASNEFISAAFRFGHSLLPSTIERWSVSGKYIDARRLSELLRQPYDLYKGGFSDQYAMGLISQVAQAMDDSISQEVTNHLFQMPEHRFGMDLAAINMQRGREHGIRGYNDYRQYCGLGRLNSFEDLRRVMTNSSFAQYAHVYNHPDDIDLWSGGISEKSVPGGMVGPTLACIIGEQFHNLKYGDRFWFEQKGYPSSFTDEQIDEIRRLKLSSIVCDNTDHIEKVQLYAMVLPDHKVNPLTPCASLPRINLERWKDINSGSGPASVPVYESRSPHQVEFVVPPSSGNRLKNHYPPPTYSGHNKSNLHQRSRPHDQVHPHPSPNHPQTPSNFPPAISWMNGGRQAKQLSGGHHQSSSVPLTRSYLPAQQHKAPSESVHRQKPCCEGTWAPVRH